MNIKNVTSNRGPLLLAELKALVDSFPDHQRNEVIKIFNAVFTRLSADYQSRHSAARWQGGESSPRSPSSATLESGDSSE